MNRQTIGNKMDELINPFGTVTKQTKWIRTDKRCIDMNDPFSPVIKQTKWAKIDKRMKEWRSDMNNHLVQYLNRPNGNV